MRVLNWTIEINQIVQFWKKYLFTRVDRSVCPLKPLQGCHKGEPSHTITYILSPLRSSLNLCWLHWPISAKHPPFYIHQDLLQFLVFRLAIKQELSFSVFLVKNRFHINVIKLLTIYLSCPGSTFHRQPLYRNNSLAWWVASVERDYVSCISRCKPLVENTKNAVLMGRSQP